jgi:hypothetical protein
LAGNGLILADHQERNAETGAAQERADEEDQHH